MTATILTPTDLRSACEAFAETGGTVRIQGAGTAASWAGTIGAADVVVDTTGLTGIRAYNPADMTVSVGAGTPLDQLQDEVAQHGQRVAFDAARVRRGATVAGLIATADSGPLALGYGSMRDLVIGATVVLADGTPARTGGHVIKNVAGYDLAKLMHGSYGAYGLMAEVVLRLHPAPEAQRTVALDCTLPEAADHTRSLLAEAQEPVSLEWADGTLLVRIEGTTDGTTARARRLVELTGGRALSDDEAAESWQRHARLVDDATVRVGCRPSRLPGVLGRFDSPAVAGLATGVATLSVPAAQVDHVHDAVTEAGGTSVRRSASGGQARSWGQQPSALHVLRAIKRELDPAFRLDAERFGTWLKPAAAASAEPAGRDTSTGTTPSRAASRTASPTASGDSADETAHGAVTPDDAALRPVARTQAPTDSGGTEPAGTEQEDS
ncbi:glycolate oxidase FAD binding subunit [Prauserella sediminis]|uniref:Glycolate oxidase FAD binding subunit n=1 Tax=Prauserella sediminis TaxID=577680 RepID=A0A839XHY7_9PSEU|nr:FAD-binding protein [Prauserella sediminis]MBB3662371.1 glycolate oxidase FAD binding subunit [Prauserella sediminis]